MKAKAEEVEVDTEEETSTLKKLVKYPFATVILLLFGLAGVLVKRGETRYLPFIIGVIFAVLAIKAILNRRGESEK